MLTVFGLSLVSGFGLGLGCSAGTILGAYAGAHTVLVIDRSLLPENYSFLAQFASIDAKIKEAKVKGFAIVN